MLPALSLDGAALTQSWRSLAYCSVEVPGGRTQLRVAHALTAKVIIMHAIMRNFIERVIRASLSMFASNGFAPHRLAEAPSGRDVVPLWESDERIAECVPTANTRPPGGPRWRTPDDAAMPDACRGFSPRHDPARGRPLAQRRRPQTVPRPSRLPSPRPGAGWVRRSPSIVCGWCQRHRPRASPAVASTSGSPSIFWRARPNFLTRRVQPRVPNLAREISGSVRTRLTPALRRRRTQSRHATCCGVDQVPAPGKRAVSGRALRKRTGIRAEPARRARCAPRSLQNGVVMTTPEHALPKPADATPGTPTIRAGPPVPAPPPCEVAMGNGTAVASDRAANALRGTAPGRMAKRSPPISHQRRQRPRPTPPPCRPVRNVHQPYDRRSP